jgi:hypothetical protein
MRPTASPDAPVEQARRRRWHEPSSIRGTLYAGFGLVFVLWLASGIDLVRRAAEVEERATAVSAVGRGAPAVRMDRRARPALHG